MASKQLLESGIINVVLGTIQEVLWVTKDLNLTVEYLYRPSTQEIIAAVSTEEFFASKPKLFIIVPKLFKLVPRKITAKTALTGYELPNDEYLTVSPRNYICIISDSKDVAKKVQGGPYKLVSFKNIDYGLVTDSDELRVAHQGYPFTLQRRLTYRSENSPLECTTAEYRLVSSLVTSEGALEWGNFTKAQLYKYFITPEVDTILLLAKTRSWCLEPYLRPFLDRLNEQYEVDNPGAILQQFALWVYCSSSYWARPKEEGLVEYINTRGRYIGVPTFIFKPSAKARTEFNKLFGL